MKCDIFSETQRIVISSTGGAAQHQGGALGQFEYLEDQGYYVQTSTEKGNEDYVPVYLYFLEDKWWVHHTPGEHYGWLQNPTPSKTLPTSGWQWADGNVGWPDDPSLTITSGPLPPLCTQYTVTATGAAARMWPSSLGVFSRTERWWNGRPVFVNNQGQLLHHGHGWSKVDKLGYGWIIGTKLGYAALQGYQSHASPISQGRWRYWTGSEYKPADVTVTGSKC